MDEERKIPKYVFDKEYTTQWRREVQFLESKGITYTYAKRHFKYPIICYKYTKTPELFLALAEFYNTVRNERLAKSIEKTAAEVLPIEKGCIEVKASDLSEGEKTLMNIKEEDVISVIADDTE